MTVVLTVFMAVNMGLSALALARYDARTSGLAPANQLDVFLDEHFDNARMERVYPNAKKPADPAAINAKSTAPARFWGVQCFWFVQPLLSGKDLYLVLVHEGGTGKACCFQLAQLLAELLALRQDGDVVGIAQGSGLAQDGGEVGVLTVEQCDLLLCAGDLITLLEQDAADALEADGEADCRHLRAEELAHHVVIAAAPATAPLNCGQVISNTMPV